MVTGTRVAVTPWLFELSKLVAAVGNLAGRNKAKYAVFEVAIAVALHPRVVVAFLGVLDDVKAMGGEIDEVKSEIGQLKRGAEQREVSFFAEANAEAREYRTFHQNSSGTRASRFLVESSGIHLSHCEMDDVGERRRRAGEARERSVATNRFKQVDHIPPCGKGLRA